MADCEKYGMFSCDGVCRLKSFLCDHTSDCSNDIDEQGCSYGKEGLSFLNLENNDNSSAHFHPLIDIFQPDIRPIQRIGVKKKKKKKRYRSSVTSPSGVITYHNIYTQFRVLNAVRKVARQTFHKNNTRHWGICPNFAVVSPRYLSKWYFDKNTIITNVCLLQGRKHFTIFH